MGKPSVFSKDYEKIMKKRRKNRRIIFFFVNLILAAGVIKIMNVDLGEVRENLQNWVDEGKTEDLIVEKEKEVQVSGSKAEIKEEYITVDINQCKVDMHVENDKIIKFKNMPKDIHFEKSRDEKSVVIINEKQETLLINAKGEVTNLTMQQYISKKGTIFKKDSVLEKYENYIWADEARFISDNLIVYKSNIPYFGTDLNQYIGIVDITTKEHKTLWNYKTKEIKFGEFTDKGLEVTINGKINYVDKNGKLIW